MKLNVSVLGSGNFGGQVAAVASEYGLKAIAINASEQDLKLLPEDVVTLVIGDGKGTGKNADYAQEFLLEHLTFLRDEVVENFINSSDVIVLAASAGGGFGSNTVPVLTKILTEMYPDKLFIPLCTLPDEGETYTAQMNTQNYLKAIIDADVPYIVYDNDKFRGKSPHETSKLLFENILKDLYILAGDYIADTTIGGIDERDLLTTLSTPGRLLLNIVDPLEEFDLKDGSIVATIKDSIVKSAHAAMPDDKVIQASAISYLVDDTMDKYTSAIKTELQDVFGPHITDYRNEAKLNGDEESADSYVATILAGLTAPTNRIDKIIARTEAMEKALTERKQSSSKLSSTEAKFGLTSKRFGAPKSKSQNDADLDDILSKYMK